jgi:hypothetical protein
MAYSLSLMPPDSSARISSATTNQSNYTARARCEKHHDPCRASAGRGHAERRCARDGYLAQVLQQYPSNTQARAMPVKYQVDVDKTVPSLELSAKAVAPFTSIGRSGDLNFPTAHRTDRH